MLSIYPNNGWHRMRNGNAKRVFQSGDKICATGDPSSEIKTKGAYRATFDRIPSSCAPTKHAKDNFHPHQLIRTQDREKAADPCEQGHLFLYFVPRHGVRPLPRLSITFPSRTACLLPSTVFFTRSTLVHSNKFPNPTWKTSR